MRRVVVLGAPGCGKTTVAAQVAARLGVRHVEIDALYWLQEWIPRDREAFRVLLAEATSEEGWVLDGNYNSAGAREIAWPRADTLVWLDLPRRISARRVFVRWLIRSMCRTELWSRNRERWRHVRDRDWIVRYAWTEHHRYRRYEEMAAGDERWVRLRSPREVRAWLARV